MRSHRRKNALGHFAQRKRHRSAKLVCLMHRFLFVERQTHHACDVVYGDRLKASCAATGKGEYLRRKPDQSSQHVHELILGAEDHRWAEHGPSQAAGFDRVLSNTLTVQKWVARAAVRAVL